MVLRDGRLRPLGWCGKPQACHDMVMPGPDPKPLRIRAGLHCGPVHAGVIGYKKPQFTFLGDTVNTASRMESHGFPNCVHVRAVTPRNAGRRSGEAGDSALYIYTCVARRVRLARARGAARRAQLTEATRLELMRQGVPSDYFVSCGARDIKSKGRMQTYLAKARTPPPHTPAAPLVMFCYCSALALVCCCAVGRG